MRLCDVSAPLELSPTPFSPSPSSSTPRESQPGQPTDLELDLGPVAANHMACVPVSHFGSVQAPDPTTALREALVGFENVLTEDQKRRYKDSAKAPSITGVIAFVAEIDSNNNDAIRRCVAPRLCTFLEATQQFSEVVGVFVSSNPQIAALVWGGIKTAISIASNITSYFGKVTSMIMEIGRSCPNYQQFGQLYPGCVGLQRELCDYYATIIQLFTKIVEVSRRPLITQTLSSIFHPFESDFKDFIEKLRQATDGIQQQISLASKQASKEAKRLLEDESENNAVFRRLTSKFQKESRREYDEAQLWRIRMLKREAARLRSGIRDNLSAINYAKHWKQAIRQRVPSTAEWLHQEPVFLEWQSDQDTSILWCSGKMGAGKTVLMSNVVARLHATCGTGDVISYYFCRSDDISSLSARNILGSLARQILETQIKNMEDEDLQRLYEDSQDLQTADIVQFVLCRLQADKRYYLVIDGLDECETVEIRKVAQAVTHLCEDRTGTLKILFSGRPDLEKYLFGSVKPKYRVPLAEAKVDLDMERFIETTLRLCLEEETLKLGNEILIVEISETLRKGSKGMFLWARLFIEDLCACGRDSEVREALQHPPRGISEIFDRRLCRVREKPTGKDAITILQYCGVVKRPLTLMEYREALSISPGQTTLNRQGLLNDMESVVRDCCGLAFTDEEDSTVHYVHHSVKQHLFQPSSSHSHEFDSQRLDSYLSVLCMTYVDFIDFKGRLAKVTESSNTPIKPVQLGILPFGGQSGAKGRLALKLLSYKQQLRDISPREIERKAQELLHDEESSALKTQLMERDFHFLEYARLNWITHMPDINPDEDSSTWRLFRRCVEEDDIVLCKPWETMSNTDEEQSELPKMPQWLMVHGHFSMLLYCLKHQSHVLTDKVKDEMFSTFCLQDKPRLVNCMLQHTSVSANIIQCEMFLAWKNGACDVQEVLLQQTVNVDSPVHGQTALQAAAANGHLKAVERLLAAKAEVNVSPTSEKNSLQAESQNGYAQTVDRLLVAKAKILRLHRSRYTALQTATIEGYLEITERLLATNDKVPDGSEYTTRYEAVMSFHLNFVQRLLTANANINLPRHPPKLFQRKVLQSAAAAEAHLEIVGQLLAEAALDETGPSMLHIAAAKNYLDIVEQLLASKANFESSLQGFSGTALQLAASGGHLEIVKRLLAANANVNAPSHGYLGTALQAAAAEGHLEVVELLLAAKADVNASGHPGKILQQTALQAAASGGHLDIVERLVAADADVLAQPQGIEGQTALTAATLRPHFKIMEYLEDCIYARHERPQQRVRGNLGDT